MPLLKFIKLGLVLSILSGCANNGLVKPSVDANVESNIIEIPSQAAEDFKVAIALMNENKLALAESHFLKMTEDYPNLSGSYANLGVIYSHNKEWDKAEEMLYQASVKNPKNVKVLNQLGFVYRQKGAFSKAETRYLQAVDVAPNDPAAYLNLGILFDIYMGQLVKASEYYQRYQNLQDKPDRRVAGWLVDINRRAGIKPTKTQIASEAP